MKTMSILFALVTMVGSAAAFEGEWRGRRDEAREQARFELQRRLSQCGESWRCQHRARRDFKHDMARINRGVF